MILSLLGGAPILRGLATFRDVLKKVEKAVVLVKSEQPVLLSLNLVLPREEMEALLRDPRVRRGLDNAEVMKAELPTCPQCGKFTG
jgi:hypothetical protein